MQTTSIQNRNESYYAILAELPEKRARVYQAILKLNKATTQQVAAHLEIPINEVSGRITELSKAGLVLAVGSIYNSRTGKNNTRWQAVKHTKNA